MFLAVLFRGFFYGAFVSRASGRGKKIGRGEYFLKMGHLFTMLGGGLQLCWLVLLS